MKTSATQPIEGRQTWMQLHVALIGAAALTLTASHSNQVNEHSLLYPSHGSKFGESTQNRSYQSLTVIPHFTAPRSAKPYIPRTELGKRLLEQRTKAIAAGMRLLSASEIHDEIARRRGEGA